MLPQINNYFDLIKKLEYDRERYRQNNGVYELMDCLFTLNALPEWIEKSSEASEELKTFTQGKIKVMQGFDGFRFDEGKLDSDIDHKIRFIRMVCNHSKHKKYYPDAPVIKSVGAGAGGFPYTLPIVFVHMIFIGSKGVNAGQLINDVSEFWKEIVSTL